MRTDSPEKVLEKLATSDKANLINDATPLIDDAGTRRAQMREVWTGRESNRSSENDPKRALLCVSRQVLGMGRR